MTPDPERARIAALDAIRGFALIAILIVNAIGFAQPSPVYSDPALSPVALSAMDKALWWGITTFLSGKAYSLFAMLFGISLFMVGVKGDLSAAQAGTGPFAHILRRRLLVLMLMGILHGALIWDGDILLLYAVCGLVLWQWRRSPAQALLLGGLILYMVSSALILYNLNLTFPSGTHPNLKTLGTDILKMHDGLWGSLQLNFQHWSAIIIPTIILYLPKTMGLMMIGMGLLKSGFFAEGREKRLNTVLILSGAGCLIALGMQNQEVIARNFPYPDILTGMGVLNEFMALWVALAYAAAITRLVESAQARALLSPLRALGRMALTNYLLQSVIMTSLCFGGRLSLFGWTPLYGRVNISQLMPFVVVIVVVQAIGSSLWLRFFQFGPVEWVWRCLTYGRVIPLKYAGK